MMQTIFQGPGRILVVDDVMENVRVLHRVLQGEHQVSFALDGRKAVEVARSLMPDLILLDAVMPSLDGYAVCAELKNAPETKDIPIIFVTSLNNPEDETRALEAGAVDFIQKPLNAAVVRARVRTHLTLKRQGDLLREMTMTDALTGVANRRCFDSVLEREWKRCERAALPLTLILCDVDHFKLYNDHYGHPEGDRCLADVAKAMQASLLRPSDLLARYGGEEFAILLPHQDRDGARAVAQRILDNVRNLNMVHAVSPTARCVTVSLGMRTMVPSRSAAIETLLADADLRLYEAKEAGRNRYADSTSSQGSCRVRLRTIATVARALVGKRTTNSHG